MSPSWASLSPSWASLEPLTILLLSYAICLPKLKLAWRLVTTRVQVNLSNIQVDLLINLIIQVNLFNHSLGICLGVAG